MGITKEKILRTGCILETINENKATEKCINVFVT